MSDITTKLQEAQAQLTAPGVTWEIDTDTFDGIEYKYYKQAPKSLKELLDAGRVHGDNEFLLYEGERYSFNEFFAKADALAYQLVNEFGVKAGERVAIAMRNYPEWMMAFTAAASVGAVVVPLNSWGKAEELEYGVTDAGATLLFADEIRANMLLPKLATLDLKMIVVRPETAIVAPGVYEFNEIVTPALGQACPEVTVDAEDDAMIMYTSGTTGNPKGALSSHRNICQAIFNFEFAAIASAMTNGEAIGKMLEKGFPPKVLLAVPLFHVSGCHSVFMLSLRGGRSIAMMYKWDAEEALKLIEAERITMISAVPTMLWHLLESPKFNDYDTNSLFSVGAGGAAQQPLLPELIQAKVDNAYPGTGYGMTETNATGFASSGAAYFNKPLSGGVITPIVECKVCDEQGNTLAQGATGEIYLKTPTSIKRYWHKPEATAETFKDGWVVTGDVGHLDDDGYIHITDRIKDMIIRGGENIYSAEIEACVHSSNHVDEVAAFGVPHESLGEELAIAVVLKQGINFDADAIKAFVKERLAAFKVPAYIQFYDTELPKNASGKVLKKAIKDSFSI